MCSLNPSLSTTFLWGGKSRPQTYHTCSVKISLASFENFLGCAESDSHVTSLVLN